MNYFGHAAMATRSGERAPAFVLGAMLPDLTSMTGTGVVATNNALLNDGIAFHLKTDALFHEHPLFHAWHSEALVQMRDAGVAKGPARAAAHVGIEMLIDDALAREREQREGYVAALEYGCSEFETRASYPHLREVCRTLLRFVARIDSTDVERLFVRLSRTLEQRPRLAPSAVDLSVIVKILTEFRAPVNAELPVLVEDLLAGLITRG